MIHLRTNLEQAARFSIRVENRLAAETAIRMIDNGTLNTRSAVDSFIHKALERARQNRQEALNEID